MPEVKKVTILGFDGLDPILLEKWLDELPNFKHLIETGYFSYMDTVYPPVTPGAWTSMVTGLNPGRTGILGFFRKKKGEYGFYPVYAMSMKAIPFWRILASNGIKCGLIGLPIPGPIDKIEYFNVSGRFTELETYPEDLKKELQEKGFESKALDIVNIVSMEGIKKAKSVVYKEMDLRLDITKILFSRFNPPFRMVVFNEPDTLHHFLDDEKEILELYKKVDEIVGELRDPQGITIIVSDHGFSHKPLRGTFYLGEWLRRKGYLKLKESQIKRRLQKVGITKQLVQSLLGKLRILGIKNFIPSNLRRLLPCENPSVIEADIDWPKTKLYTEPSFEAIYINLKGREPDGVVSPGEEYYALIDSVKKDLAELTNEGEKIDVKIWKKDELYWGALIEELPDLILYIPEYKVIDKFGDRVFTKPTLWKNSHLYEGTLIIQGKDISRKNKGRTKIYDVAPTVLYLLGAPIPKDLDGRVIKEAINPQKLLIEPPKYTESIQDERLEIAVDTDKEKEVLKRLRGLGYIR